MSDPSCVGCGYCCSKAPCGLGYSLGATEAPCKFLVEAEGRKWCQLVLSVPEDKADHLKNILAIGAGCSSTLFNDVRDAQIRRAKK